MKKLRTLTIVLPIVYLFVVEIFSLLVLVPLFGNNAYFRLFALFLLLVTGTVPFSRWVFSTIEQQQRRLVESTTVLEAITDYAIFMLDPSGNIRTWNLGAELVRGYTAGEIIGESIRAFYLPEDVEGGRPERNLQIALVEGRSEDEGWRLRKDGSRYWANVLTTAVQDDTGLLLGYTQVVSDITDRRHAEERIRRLNDELERRVGELARANQEISHRNRQLAAVNTAIVSVSSALDLGDVLENIVDAARELLHSRYAALGVADEHGRIMQFITSGITREERAAIGPLPEGHGLLGALIQEAKPLRIPNIASDPRSYGFPGNHPPMTSLLGVPILFNGKPVGDLYLTNKIGAGEFSQDDQDLVMLLANHAAVAIQNARLYEEVRSARDRLEAWNQELEARVAERTREIGQYSKMLTTRVLQAQEEERKRIARELHDDTAQSLSTLLINLDLIEPQIPASSDVLRDGFDRVRTIAKRTLDATRALSHDLRPTILDDFGLVAALHWFADEYTGTFGVPVDVQVKHPRDHALTPEVELALFRIAQEALTNSGKYAEATRASVTLTVTEAMAQLLVEDNGKGFTPGDRTAPTRRGGLGLYGMEERAELLGGHLTVETAPDRGTRITAVIPLIHPESDESMVLAEPRASQGET